MRKIYISLSSILIINLLATFSCFAEGSKQIWINNDNTNLYICNDFVGKCNSGQGDRSQFAVYDCAETERLYFQIKTTDEVVYIGLNANSPSSVKLKFRIKEAAGGTVVFAEQGFPLTGEEGFITDIDEARVGPEELYGATGYDAIQFTPPGTGLYFIEFNRFNSTTGEVVIGNFTLNLFDITVADAVTMIAQPGRVYSKCWQFTEGGDCSATTFIYSDDGIITSIANNNLNGGTWIQFCNVNGCGTSGNFNEDRKSLYNQQALLPQYKIFLNNPDPDLFPPATTLGQILPPDPWGERFCNSGSIIFHVNVDKTGNVVIMLDFDPPYVDIPISGSVIAGENLITWNGLDGAGVPVPNNANIFYSVSYINGLTNLPLYDVESNNNGFTISLISPPGPVPPVFWDDSNIPGGTTNFSGCTVSPCHTWGDGDHHTMNTWWYNVSTSTGIFTIAEWRGPQALVFNQSPPIYCPTSSGHLISVTPDPNATDYHFSYTGIGATINQINPTDPFITVDFLNATSGNIQVYGTNANCPGAGPITSLAITIQPLPNVSLSPLTPVCVNTASFQLTNGSPAGGVYSGTGVSAGFFTPLVAGVGTHTITYTYTDMYGCSNSTTTTIIVKPLPVVSFVTPFIAICSGTTINVTPQSTIPGSSFTWSATTIPPGVTVTPSSGTGDISCTIANTNAIQKTVIFSVPATANGCNSAAPGLLNVFVNPLPTISISGISTLCTGPTSYTYTTQVGMTDYSWIVNGGTIAGGGSNTDNSVTVIWDTPGAKTILVNYTNGSGCTALTASSYSITVNPLPVPSITGPGAVCLNNSVSYSTEVGKTGYLWVVPTGGSISSGNGTSTITVNWTSIGGHTVEVNYTDANGCTAASPKIYNVNVNLLPVPLINVDLTPICVGESRMYSSDAGMNNYTWIVSAGGNTTAGGGTSDDYVTVQWITVGPQSVSVNYELGSGCTAANPTVKNEVVNPLPSPVITGFSPVCEFSTANIYSTPNTSGNAYSWTISGGTINSGAGTNQVSVTWGAAGTGTLNVTETITPTGCAKAASTYSQQIDPYPVTPSAISGVSAICRGKSTVFSVSPVQYANNLIWSYSGSGATINYTSSTSVTIDFDFNATSGTLLVKGQNNCGDGPLSPPKLITVNPLPVLTFTLCQPVTSQNAKPFPLKGGYPASGLYSGQGVVGSNFNPSTLTPGNFKIRYTVNNVFSCVDSLSATMTVLPSQAFTCGQGLTDARDGQTYPTNQFDTQCWMAANLNYGNAIGKTNIQRDNCATEKFCYNDVLSNCASRGGLYQWDELMQFEESVSQQGVCPFGWHVPTESEWMKLIKFFGGAGFAGSPMKSTGFSGFNAFLSGGEFQNLQQAYMNEAALFWSSTESGKQHAWAHGMNVNTPSTSYKPALKSNALSVRCVKD